MKSTSAVLALAALVAKVSAFPQFAEELEKRQDANEWIPAGPGDVRSPCPGTNTLANHGYINRNGKGITAAEYQQAFLDAFGMDPAATAAGAQNAINQCTQMTGSDCSTTGFNLDMLNTPHEIEHDGSLSRHDAEQSDGQDDNHDFAMDVWQMSLDAYGSCTTHVNTDLASYVRLTRNSEAQAADVPGWFQLNAGGQEAEHAFSLTSMNDPAVNTDLNNPQARLDWISYWFENERLPTALGWVKQAVSNDNFNAVSGAVANSPGVAPNCAANPSKTPSGPGSYPTMVPYGNGTSTSTGTSPDKSSSVKSSVCDVATSIVGPAPSAPNAYKTVLPAASWASYESEVKVYVTKVEYVASSVLAKAGYTATGAAAPQGAASAAATNAATSTITVAPAAMSSAAAVGSSAAAAGSSMASAYLATASVAPAAGAAPSSTAYAGAANRMEAFVAGGAVIAGLAAFL